METKKMRYSTPVCESVAMEPEGVIALSPGGEWWTEEEWDQD